MNRQLLFLNGLLIFLVTVAFLIVITQEAGGSTIVVAKDGSGDFDVIQYAVENATDGDTIEISGGEYQEQIIIDRSLTIEGSGAAKTHILGSGTGHTIRIEENWVALNGLNISGGGNQLTDSDVFIEANNTSITNCKLIDPDSYIGILLKESKYNSISNSIINSHNKGIESQDSKFLTIEDNDCSHNYNAIYLKGTSDSSISRNNCTSGTIRLDSSVMNTIDENNCSGNALGHGIFLSAGSNENTVQNNNCNYAYRGITLENSDENTVTNNKCFGTLTSGIYMFEDSDRNELDGNNCSGSTYHGIYIYTDCDENIITNCIIDDNFDHGVHVRGNCLDNEVHDSTITGNINGGIDTSSDSEVNATNNWWGHYTGPYHHDANIDAFGDSVTDDVLYDPWILGPHDVPVAIIVSIDPTPAPVGQLVTFTASGLDDDFITQYSWTSSLDGEFSIGPDPIITNSSLSEGTHTITLKVLDDRDTWSDGVSQELGINSPSADNRRPSITITDPEADKKTLTS